MKTFHLSLGIGLVAILSMISLFIGAGDITPASLLLIPICAISSLLVAYQEPCHYYLLGRN